MGQIGILAVQGGFEAHARALRALGHQPVELRATEHLAPDLAGLVLPGGESSAQLDLIDRLALAAPLDRLIRAGIPVLATCAGLILAARRVRAEGPGQASLPTVQRSFGWLDVEVARNAYGRQLASFEARSDSEQLPLVFIRAPRIIETGREVEVLQRHAGVPVLVRQGRVFGATFHPELTGDLRIHRLVFGGTPTG